MMKLFKSFEESVYLSLLVGVLLYGSYFSKYKLIPVYERLVIALGEQSTLYPEHEMLGLVSGSISDLILLVNSTIDVILCMTIPFSFLIYRAFMRGLENYRD